MSGFIAAIVTLGLLAAYLLGSIPTGFLLGKALQGIDIREHGSGNTGATNVFRVIGKGAGITALVIDLIKGLVAVRLMMALISLFVLPKVGTDALIWIVWVYMFAAALAVVGHSKSVWIGFAGGKSAATGLGVLLALVWPVGLSAAAVFVTAVLLSRTVSVGSIAAALSVAVFMIAMQQPLPYVLLAIAGGGYVILRHRSNISRLLTGTEPKTFGG
ncbi:MAG: acyl-phosphate glycerol 3-phosphate acyltransferase PlsY [Phormidesmis priestleyi Ana]|uniref:Glycerol-3-phosphate acyltransferase n=1 Tax=Phormidesmis priestleyi Ana TaxID=1666911 RepID=A0A0N8KN71_9CYAN|nr:MAG: acyl-phosphate glycerol 3-phosphate acyltransferase PlsY [Phormidesmis priestleyi Ana]